MQNFNLYKYESGAALVIGLVLLVVVTVLAISGMNTATNEREMARNDQNAENAFQAAETGLEHALARGQFNTLGNIPLQKNINSTDSVTAIIQFERATMVPNRSFSLGVGSGIAAYHFIATASAESKRAGIAGERTDRDSTSIHTQAFYIVGPEIPTL